MAKIIREDLDGVVTAYDKDGTALTLSAGEEIPDGVRVDDSLVGDKTRLVPETTRKPLAEDPSDYKVAEVNDYLAKNPEQAAAVLALEEAGEARKGILQGPHAPKS